MHFCEFNVKEWLAKHGKKKAVSSVHMWVIDIIVSRKSEHLV